MPRRHRCSRASLVPWILAAIACGGDSGSGDSDVSSSSGAMASASSDSTAAQPGTTAEPTSAASDGSTDSGGDTAVSACEAWASGQFAACNDTPAYTACGWQPSGPSAVSLTCLQALEVEGGSVCALIDCSDRCDCFAPPATGTATVECLEGVVADHTVCALYCGNGEQCPDGMECSVQSCVWPPS